MRYLLLLALALMAWPTRAEAHVGSPNVFYEGKAGPYAVRVVVRPPDVAPGLAEISVRVTGAGVRRVTALPVYWNAGREGAPPADEAKRVAGEADLYSTTLWLMKPGAYSVDVAVEGEAGQGLAVVPVDSTPLVRKEMPRWIAVLLTVLGLSLFATAVRIVGAAIGEATLAPGVKPGPAERRKTWLAMAGAAILLGLLLYGGRGWWDQEDASYRRNRLYKAQTVATTVREAGGQKILRLAVDIGSVDGRRPNWSPLLPDHGKMMHLFLIREPGLDAFAHIHPQQLDAGIFEVVLPPLPSGEYQIYADVTHENGSARTLVAKVALADTAPGGPADSVKLAADPDDSWYVGGVAESAEKVEHPVAALPGGGSMTWERPETLRVNHEASLRFRLADGSGKALSLEPYMGMMGHAAIRRDDGAVFAHLHPVGSISMASQAFFTKGGKPKKAKAPREKAAALPPGTAAPEEEAPMDHSMHMMAAGPEGEVFFPYEFPSAGRYHVWVQVRSGGQILTGVFETEVAEK